MAVATEFNKVDLRKAYPLFYYIVAILALVRVGLGFNFFFSRPTFMPYGFHKTWAGLVFLVLGLFTLGALQLREIRWIRHGLAVSSAVMMIWGLVNSQQWFHGKASLQLPIVFIGIGLVQVVLIMFGPRVPVLEKK